ncbi:membrane fusion protein (multidrug efflux system) [Prosthecobacter fusiformis]|uniref:Membrane fusion protein (Multidrug efflux system) n=1 Tax=Prosthecobacter fusiformis TaxID=48464 RepID=A0A4R7S3E8_9BACT|nr:efflux RND transporter periplasmic adaptor subunit [Prosthecobacter fusiformis]TDU72910.1 membrane fusion protein (multidrug efflux system) [Prosthecobacter fusiformis]
MSPLVPNCALNNRKPISFLPVNPVYKIITLLWMSITYSALGIELPAAKPHKGTIHRWISLPASLAAWQQVALKARVAGYVKDVSVDKGDVVSAGQTLIEIEVPELQADLISHRATVTAAEVEVKRLHEARKKSPDLILPQSVDDAEARLAIAKAGMDRAETLLQFAQIKAPFAATISDRRVDPGAYAAAGGETLLHLVDATTLRLQVPVIEMESSLIKPGQQVEARLEALSGSVVKGSISRTSTVLDPATRTLLVEADLKNEDGRLRPGMFVTARLAVEQHDGATLIPVAGLVKEKASSFVFKHVNGKAVKTAVKPGFNDGVNVELPELKADDVILLPGTIILTDGQDVTVK